MRDEMDEVFKHLIRFETSGIPANMVICGSRGSGKTLIFKYLQRTISQKTDLEVLYVSIAGTIPPVSRYSLTF
jgi:Cdc6-like AAA superfamily ATPase